METPHHPRVVTTPMSLPHLLLRCYFKKSEADAHTAARATTIPASMDARLAAQAALRHYLHRTAAAEGLRVREVVMAYTVPDESAQDLHALLAQLPPELVQSAYGPAADAVRESLRTARCERCSRYEDFVQWGADAVFGRMALVVEGPRAAVDALACAPLFADDPHRVAALEELTRHEFGAWASRKRPRAAA